MAQARVNTYPIQFKGKVVSFVVNIDTETGVSTSFDINYRGVILNKADEELRRDLGFSEEDYKALVARGHELLDAREGTRLGSSGPLY